jgi:type IV pilus assembly protein PilY1
LATPYPAPTLLAILQDPSGNPQPMTTSPEIAIHPVTRKRYVMVGTGQLLAPSDVISTQMQTFYAILDGTASSFISPLTTPYTRSNLTALTTTQLTNINSLTGAGAQGWYTDLGIDPTSGIGYRVIIDPVSYNGIVAFTTLLTVVDPCAPAGTSRVYALDYSSATSVLEPTPLAFFSSDSTVISVRVAGANGTPEIVVGYNPTNGSPTVGKVNANLTNPLATRTLNWREIPTIN